MQFLSTTPFSMFTYQDLHDLHVYCGWIILLYGLLHTLFHLLRWASQGNLSLLWDQASGRSGIVISVSTLLIYLPMLVYKKEKVSYEIRKYFHYFFVVMAIALSFHTTRLSNPARGYSVYIFPVLIGWYALDTLYLYFFMTEKITSTVFHVLPTGVQLTMAVSERFQKQVEGSGGYCYVNFPWISKTQWHAFSMFENPAKPAERQIYIQVLGDWTKAVHAALQRDTARPVWIQGPFSSPYDSAVDFDNQILVAGGIGITPAISVCRAHKDTRRSNLIWAVRDPYMLEFFLKNGEFSTKGWNLIFYTGTEPLYFGNARETITSTGATVHIIRKRPDFEKLIPNLIYSIESGTFKPETFVSESKLDAIDDLKEKLEELDCDPNMQANDKLAALVSFSGERGYLFSELVAGLLAKDKDTLDMLQSCLGGRAEGLERRLTTAQSFLD
jgi:ferric-chelate reductase